MNLNELRELINLSLSGDCAARDRLVANVESNYEALLQLVEDAKPFVELAKEMGHEKAEAWLNKVNGDE